MIAGASRGRRSFINCWYLRIRGKLLSATLARVIPRRQRSDLVRLGSSYGGWIVPAGELTQGAICYTVGLGEDGSFDRALAQEYGCEVFVFDPTPRAIFYAKREFMNLASITFFPLGMWSQNAVLRFFAPRDPANVSHSIVNLQGTADFFDAPCASPGETMRSLGHKSLTLLKLDVEGAEYEVLQSIVRDQLDISVICVEFDQPVPIRNTISQIRALRRAGYTCIAAERWNYTFVRRA